MICVLGAEGTKCHIIDSRKEHYLYGHIFTNKTFTRCERARAA